MKRKMLMIGAAAIVAVVVFFVGWYFMFTCIGVGPAYPFAKAMELETYDPAEEGLGQEPLMAFAESEEAAKSIAEQYGITFVSFQNGVATYATDEDPSQVIDRGEKNGYPELYLNQKRELQGGQMTEVDPSLIKQDLMPE